MKTVIVGLGYVGLPLALQFCRSGLDVAGLDIDPAKVAALNRGDDLFCRRGVPGVREGTRHTDRRHLAGDAAAKFAQRHWRA